LEEIPADEEIMRDAADILFGMTLGRRGEFDRAADFSVRCIQRKKALQKAASHTALAIPTLVPFLATIYMFQGRLHAADSLSHEFLDLFKEKGIRVSTAGNLDVVLGGVLYEWNRLDEAEKYIRDGLQANEPWGNIMTDAFGLLVLAHVLQAKGDYCGAMQVVEKFETRLQRQSRPMEFAEDFRTLRVRVQLASGDLQTAFNWATQVLQSDDFHRHPEYYRLTLARIWLAQKRYAEVEEILRGMASENFPGNLISRQIEINLLLAVAIAEKEGSAAQQRLSEAVKIIAACLALAEPEGFIQAFLSVGEPVRELLAAYLRSDAPVHKPFAQKILEAFSPTPRIEPPGVQPAGLVEPLSGREVEVLQLMALGRTNQEIARQLIVALGTIKAHAASIYRKLDAANRTEAVARARLIGILP
jgi:LuxR family maltose regulon positive regulatory protein